MVKKPNLLSSHSNPHFDPSQPWEPQECLCGGCLGKPPVKEFEYRFCSKDCAVVWALEQAEKWVYCDRCGGWMELMDCICDGPGSGEDEEMDKSDETNDLHDRDDDSYDSDCPF